MEKSAKPTRLMHISDLHLGKSLHGYSMMEDQKHMLDQIVSAIDSERPDALLIAGDVYDRSVPREDAVSLFSRFLTEVHSRGCPVCMIAGNHDSGRRLGFGGGIFEGTGIHISGMFRKSMDRVVLDDGYGGLNIWLLPYIRPSSVRQCYGDEEISNPDDALRVAIERSGVDPGRRNVLVAHQFIQNADILPEQTESETSRAFVGGLDSMSAKLLNAFDYVALGHIHRPQWIARETIRYCGSPLKYSLSECDDIKSITIVDIAEKGNVTVSAMPLAPLRDVFRLRGTLAEMLEEADSRPELRSQYVGVVLTEFADDPESKLRKVFENLLSIEFDVGRNGFEAGEVEMEKIKNSTPQELFEEFYRGYAGKDLTDFQRETLDRIFREVEGYEADQA